MPLNVSSRLSHYDVTALIGEGGMGQVSQAMGTTRKDSDMNKRTASVSAVILTTFLLVLSAVGGRAQEPAMGFFITSVGPGDGANLGGLEGADRHCQILAW